MSEVQNKNFQKVFTTESDFKSLKEIRISREEIKEMMKELDERKALGPDGVSGYILKECRSEMAEPIHDIIN